jgi:RNA polymerase sigma-70 factor, ECF subfamily
MSYDLPKNNLEDPSSGDLRLGDGAFEVFFKEHYPKLCVYCSFKYGFDVASAEDVVNASFIKLWEVRQQLSTDISPKSYLYKIVDNRCANILKHEKVKRQHAQYLLQTTPEGIPETSFDSIDLRELRSAIDSAIAELPEQMRRIFELSRFQGLKYSQIAVQLNISVKTVETQMSRALAKLREKLSRYYSIYVVLLILSSLLKK